MSKDIKTLKNVEEDPQSDIKEDIVTPEIDESPKEKNTSSQKTVLKQVKLADAITGKGSGGRESSAPGLAGRSFGSYGGDATNITADMSNVGLGTGGGRSGTRYGRKLDPSVRAINTLGAEKTLINIDGAKSIHEDPSAVQGGIARRLNDNLIMSKTAGQTPASPLYQRSVDEIRRDELFYGVGQTVRKPNRVPEEHYYGLGYKGDHRAKALNVTFDEMGHITAISFSSDEITSYQTDDDILDTGAKHFKMHLNDVELVRRKIDATAGDESQPGWSPLGSAVEAPNALLSFFKDIEQDTGNHLYAANRFAKLSTAYQINRAGKDGDKIESPMLEAMLQDFVGYQDADADVYTGSLNLTLFNSLSYTMNSPAWMIAMGDSTQKYRTKGDFLNMPRSLKMFVQAGNNYINDLYMNPNLKAAIENTTSFSTIDGNYDGIRPALITDRVEITSPISWAQFSMETVDRIDKIEDATYTSYYDTPGTLPVTYYEYSDYRNRYVQRLGHPLLLGVGQWFLNHQDSIFKVINDLNDRLDGDLFEEGSYTLTIPIGYATTYFTTWAFILNAAAHEIRQKRLIILRDLLKYAENHSYPFEDLVSFSSQDTTNSKNFTYQGIDEPIKLGTLSPHVAITWTMPEMFFEIADRSEENNYIMMPWYFSNDNFSTSGIQYRDRYMNWPFVRDGMVLEQLDVLTSLSPRDVRLSFDVLVHVPGHLPYVGAYTSDPLMTGIPIIDAGAGTVDEDDYLSTARELGLKAVLPQRFSGDFTTKGSYVAKIYVGSLAAIDDTIATRDDGTVPDFARGSFNSQEWYYYVPSIGVSEDKFNYLPLSLSEVLGVTSPTKTILNLVSGSSVRTMIPALAGSGASDSARSSMASFANYFWTRLQILPFIISPFDAHNVSNRGESEDMHRIDPFQIPTIFGYAGMDTTEYTEDQFNRLDKEVREGYNFISDPWIEDSPIIKG